MSNAPEKTLLKKLLDDVVVPIAAGADANKILPGADGYDEKTAPNVTMRWCASVLRILLLRTIENIIDLRNGINSIRALLKDPALEDGKPWKSDLPAMREQIKEMSGLLGEIVKAIKQAQAGAGGAPSAESATEAPPVPPEVPKDPAEMNMQRQIEELAAAAARGETIPDSKGPAMPPSAGPNGSHS